MITIEISRGDVVDWLHEAATDEQAADNAAAYREELARQMGEDLGTAVEIVWNDGRLETHIEAPTFEEDEAARISYTFCTAQMANDWNWLPGVW